MKKRADEAKVGAMVIGTAALLLVTFFLMMNYNPFQASHDQYSMRIKFAGGLEKDAVVRLAGFKVGKVIAVQLKDQEPTPVEIVLQLRSGSPIRTDSIARVASLGALGENYVEISPGLVSSPLLGSGRIIRSEESPSFSELFTKVSAVSDDAQRLIGDVNKSINQISGNANTLLGNLNDVTGEQNRKAVASSLAGVNGMIANADGLLSRSSPKIEAMVSNLQASSEKVDQLTVSVGAATTKMNKLLQNVDATITENRPQLKKDIENLDATLADVRKLLADTTAMLDSNRNDLDIAIEELRRSSENAAQFTQGVKQRPYSLIRVTGPPDRKVPK